VSHTAHSSHSQKSALQKHSVRLILASASPQRRKIMADHGYVFEAADPGEVENAIAAAPTPEALAIAKARAKAMDIAAVLPPPYPAIVVGVDTLVASNKGEVIGKPLDRFDAEGILTRLSGTRHRVISGLCLWPVLAPAAPGMTPQGSAPKLASETTFVKMRQMSAEEIETYVASGEADGKAGAYAIQEKGDKFVDKIEGSFLNVVGFPLELFEKLLAESIREWKF
jgi:septum formation protein